jgi:hypothetical protein
MRVERWLPLSGIVFVVLVLAAWVGGGTTPDSDSAAAKVATFYDTHSTRHFAVAVLLAAAAPFAMLFATSVAGAYPGRGRRAWNTAVIAGSGVVAALFLVAGLIHFALTDAGNNGLGGDAIRALNTIDADTWIGFNGALGVFMLAVAGLQLTAQTSPRWLARVTLALGILLFIPYADFFALIVTGLWILVESVLLSRRADTTPEVALGTT